MQLKGLTNCQKFNIRKIFKTWKAVQNIWRTLYFQFFFSSGNTVEKKLEAFQFFHLFGLHFDSCANSNSFHHQLWSNLAFLFFSFLFFALLWLSKIYFIGEANTYILLNIYHFANTLILIALIIQFSHNTKKGKEIIFFFFCI